MLIDDLPALDTFARIVSAGSLSAAARELDLSLSVVSKRLAHLESQLGVRLLHRTTRQQTLTDDGAQFHAQVLRILAEVERAETLMSDRRGTVGGVLRVTAPGELGRPRIAPLIAAFQRRHPELTVQLMLTDAIVDLLAHDLDVAVRIGSLADSTMIARELAPNHRVLCASPSYVAAHGLPAEPAELRAHRCIVMGDQPRAEWRFDGAQGTVAVEVTAALLTNDGGAARTLALEGGGHRAEVDLGRRCRSRCRSTGPRAAGIRGARGAASCGLSRWSSRAVARARIRRFPARAVARRMGPRRLSALRTMCRWWRVRDDLR